LERQRLPDGNHWYPDRGSGPIHEPAGRQAQDSFDTFMFVSLD